MGYKKINKERLAGAISLYKNGAKIKDIEKASGISIITIKKHAKLEGVPTRKRSGKETDLFVSDNIVKDYNLGIYTISQIYKRNNVSRKTIYNILKRNKIDVRKR